MGYIYGVINSISRIPFFIIHTTIAIIPVIIIRCIFTYVIFFFSIFILICLDTSTQPNTDEQNCYYNNY